MTFKGKTVVVTGASMGIGAAIAEAFAAEGAHLILAARSRERLEEVACRLRTMAASVTIAPTDVTNPADVAQLAEVSLQPTGRVDVLVNNAGVGMNGSIETLDLAALQQCLEVNLLGAVRVLQAFVPGMKAAGCGSIVQISSVLGKVSAPFTGGYNASKFALNAVSDALRLEMAPYGVRVVSVYPGSTESNFRSNALGPTGLAKVRYQRVPASHVADRVLNAVRTGKRDVYTTFRDALLCWLGPRFPGLTDLVLRKAYGIR